MLVKIQHQMEVLNPIYIAPNMTVLAKMTILNIHFVHKSEKRIAERNRNFLNGEPMFLISTD